MKLILEKEDIEKFIKNKYGQVVKIEGIPADLSITVKVEDFVMPQQHPPQTPKLERPAVILNDGSIDAVKSGLTTQNRNITIPGKAMGRTRNKLPVF